MSCTCVQWHEHGRNLPQVLLGTHRARRELSWLNVSAPISQMRLCWRPLAQERMDEPIGSEPGSAPHPPVHWEEERRAPHFSWHRKKGPSLRKSPELKGQGDPVALGKWVRRQSHKPSLWPRRESVSRVPTEPGSQPSQSPIMGLSEPCPTLGQSKRGVMLRSRACTLVV